MKEELRTIVTVENLSINLGRHRVAIMDEVYELMSRRPGIFSSSERENFTTDFSGGESIATKDAIVISGALDMAALRNPEIVPDKTVRELYGEEQFEEEIRPRLSGYLIEQGSKQLKYDPSIGLVTGYEYGIRTSLNYAGNVRRVDPKSPAVINEQLSQEAIALHNRTYEMHRQLNNGFSKREASFASYLSKRLGLRNKSR